MTVTPAEARRAWVDALRSGEYRQTIGQLVRVRKDGSREYCCLGVACEVYKAHGGELREEARHDPLGKVYYDDEAMALPARVQNWLGLETDDGEVPSEIPTRFAPALSDLNDNGVTFDYIAEVIEERWGTA